MYRIKKIVSKSWKKILAAIGLIMIAYGLILQGLSNSEAIILFFSCHCNHEAKSEKHTSVAKQDLKSIPDCHKKADIPHVCSCKNGKILKKLNDFLAQFMFFNESTCKFIAILYPVEAEFLSPSLISKTISLRVERPPSII